VAFCHEPSRTEQQCFRKTKKGFWNLAGMRNIDTLFKKTMPVKNGMNGKKKRFMMRQK